MFGNRRPRKLAIPALAAMAAGLTACGGAGTGIAAPSSTIIVSAPTTSSTSVATTTTHPCASSIDVGSWSPERLASQMLALSSDMGSISANSEAVNDGVGGVVLMGAASSPALKSQLSALVAHAPGGVAPLVMADEEGGGIQVLSKLVGSMPWPRTMAGSMSTDQVEALAYRIGKGMRSLGVDVDLAPVVGLDSSPGPSRTNPVGMRSFSSNPATATEYARAFEGGLERAGVIPVLKHFPGLGGSSGNTDFMPAHTLSYSVLLHTGMIPFEDLGPGAKAVMVSNAVVPGLTSGVPASLSPRAISVLREQVGFRGLIMTDSLETVSIASYQPDLPEAVVEAVKAGVDMVMLASTNPNQVPTFLAARSALEKAITSGSLSVSSVDSSITRILEAKGYSSSCIYY